MSASPESYLGGRSRQDGQRAVNQPQAAHQLPEAAGTGMSFPMLQLMRPHQWVKNVLVLAPLLFSGLFLELGYVVDALLATGLFCLAASATYVYNDLNDREADARHPVKRHTRPIAAGEVSVPQARVLLAGLLGAVLAAGLYIGLDVLAAVAGYLAVTTTYSLWLKHIPVVDLFAVAAGFVLRVLAGSLALGVSLSHWMGITTLCLALYLAAVKRKAELEQQGTEARGVLEDYPGKLLDQYGLIAAVAAIGFYGLYAATVRPLLSLTIPLVLFGFYRYGFVTEREETGESPIRTALEDRWLLATLAVYGAVTLWILWPG